LLNIKFTLFICPYLYIKQSLEIGVAEPDNPDWDDATAQRHLLNKGDSFYILPNNFYRIENHSKTKPCILNWVIINSVNVDEI
jgi:hypothetical protein